MFSRASPASASLTRPLVNDGKKQKVKDEERRRKKPARKVRIVKSMVEAVKTAKELGADESGEVFERVIKKIIPPKRGKKPR